MRGKAHTQVTVGRKVRITPAYAGKSICKAACAADGAGSPPRMRGKAILHPMHCPHGRITPAYAGKRRETMLHICVRRDHPRVCGEKRSCLVRGHHRMGSPPRMRGKARHDGADPVFPGITPAYAGKRGACTRGRLRHWDHPRVCGEKTKKIP